MDESFRDRLHSEQRRVTAIARPCHRACIFIFVRAVGGQGGFLSATCGTHEDIVIAEFQMPGKFGGRFLRLLCFRLGNWPRPNHGHGWVILRHVFPQQFIIRVKHLPDVAPEGAHGGFMAWFNFAIRHRLALRIEPENFDGPGRFIFKNKLGWSPGFSGSIGIRGCCGTGFPLFQIVLRDRLGFPRVEIERKIFVAPGTIDPIPSQRTIRGKMHIHAISIYPALGAFAK